MKYRVTSIVLLSTLWMVCWGNLSIQNFFTGCILAVILSWLFPVPKLTLNLKIKCIPLVKLVAYFLYSLVQSSILVAWYAIRPQKPPSAEVVTTRFSMLRSDFIQVLAIDFLILVPGTIVVDYDVNTGKILVHNLNSAAIDAFYHQMRVAEKLMHEAFESHRIPLCDTHWYALEEGEPR